MKKLSLILCILWMGFIFYNSSQSGANSNKISFSILNRTKTEYKELTGEKKVDVTSKNSPTKVLPTTAKEEKFNLFLRKNAHAFEYLVLAILVSAVLFAFNYKGKKAIIYIMFVCLLYAVIDEFHQSFVPGRTSLVSDVLIDFLGSLIGMVLFYLAYYKLYFSRKKASKKLNTI